MGVNIMTETSPYGKLLLSSQSSEKDLKAQIQIWIQYSLSLKHCNVRLLFTFIILVCSNMFLQKKHRTFHNAA